MRWPSIPKVACSSPTLRTKPCDLWLALHHASGAQEVLPCKEQGVTDSQLFDVPSMTTFSVAYCGRQQMGAAHSTTSIALVEVYLMIDPTNCGIRFSTGGLPAIEYFSSTYNPILCVGGWYVYHYIIYGCLIYIERIISAIP